MDDITPKQEGKERLNDDHKRIYDPSYAPQQVYPGPNEDWQPQNSYMSQGPPTYNVRELQKQVPSYGNTQSQKPGEIACEDHKERREYQINESAEAIRFCAICNRLICDSCAVDFHSDHIAIAKTKIEDYCKSKIDGIEDMKAELNLQTENQKYPKEVDERKEALIKTVKAAFSTKRRQVEILIKSLQAVDKEFEILESNMIRNIENFFNEDCNKRISRHNNSITESKNPLLFIF